MIIKTKTPYVGKEKIWLKFVTPCKTYEKFYAVKFRNMEENVFIYEVDDDFPEEIVELIFGYRVEIIRR